MRASMTQPIAVCGIDCGGCDIRRIPFDPAAAERMVAWFREMEWLAEEEGVAEIVERGMYCHGCRGDRAVHWSAECPILVCCVDERGLQSCAECDSFPCTRLTDRARGNTRYAAALQRLRDMLS
jgi:hypothetical protein